MGFVIRLVMLGSLLGAIFAIVDSIRAQEATPGPAGQLIDFEDQKRRILSYSPDGTLLAVVDGGFDELCIVEVATLRDQACANLEERRINLRDEDVVWSPDSSKVAFSERAFQYFIDGDIWVMDAQTSDLTNAADDGYEGDLPFGEDGVGQALSFDVLPAWRPDGSAIAYSQSPFRDGVFRGNQIVETHLDGGSPENLVTVTLDEPGVVYYGMHWSGDGNHLLFTVSHPDRDNAQNGLWIAGRDGTNPRRIIGRDEQLGAPVVVDVTPSGDKALVWYQEAVMQYVGQGPVYAIVDTASGDVTPLEVELPDQIEVAYVSLATFSPDGTKLLTVTRLTDPEGIVQVTDLKTGATEQIGEPIPQAGMGVIGIGPEWATNGTVFIPCRITAGVIIEVEGGLGTATA